MCFLIPFYKATHSHAGSDFRTHFTCDKISVKHILSWLVVLFCSGRVSQAATAQFFFLSLHSVPLSPKPASAKISHSVLSLIQDRLQPAHILRWTQNRTHTALTDWGYTEGKRIIITFPSVSVLRSVTAIDFSKVISAGCLRSWGCVSFWPFSASKIHICALCTRGERKYFYCPQNNICRRF